MCFGTFDAVDDPTTWIDMPWRSNAATVPQQLLWLVGGRRGVAQPHFNRRIPPI